ncbi:MAG TPA: hypothetical protein VFI65_10375, partial [Streptosporangiaceae bacterium]|nr:hypothetical protein [Streptosporangiaceae bacterium]
SIRGPVFGNVSIQFALSEVGRKIGGSLTSKRFDAPPNGSTATFACQMRALASEDDGRARTASSGILAGWLTGLIEEDGALAALYGNRTRITLPRSTGRNLGGRNLRDLV